MTKQLFLVVPVAMWLAACSDAPKAKPVNSSAKPVAVSVITAATETWPSIYEATGTVRARTSAVISAKLMGYVREVKVQIGDQVREGQLLVTLDPRDLDVSSRRAESAREEVRAGIPEADSAVAAAKANLDLAQVTFGRMQDMYQKKSISNQEFDEASARLKAAQVCLSDLRHGAPCKNRALQVLDCSPHHAASIRSLFVRPALCLQLPPDSASRRTPLPFKAHFPLPGV